MKKIFNLLVPMAIVLLTVGCVKDSGSYAGFLKIGLDAPIVRTSLGSAGKVYWSEGDRIAANGQTSAAAQIDATNRGNAVFAFNNALAYPCNVLYPASFYKSATTITLPTVQQKADGTFATNTLPMAVSLTSEEETPRLHHLAGIVHLQIKIASEYESKGYYLAKVVFKGNNSEKVCGDFEIDYNEVTLSPVQESDAYSEVTVAASGELSVSEVRDVYIVVPAQEYTEGFTVRIVDKRGRFMDKKVPSKRVVHKGEVLKMPPFDFAHTGIMVDVGI